jgi:hypothetical protein
MNDLVAFLCKKAAEFRALADISPNLAGELRRIAAELEREAESISEEADVCA